VDRRRRNVILIWIIVIGLANFVSYTLIYWCLGGDATNGAIRNGSFYLRGHFIRLHGGLFSEAVSPATWIYSYLHSISIWPTIAPVLISTFILARPHIVATMKSDAVVRGTTFVAVCITAVVLVTGASTIYFVFGFVDAMRCYGVGKDYGM